MIFVHLKKSWPDVQANKVSPGDVTLGDWALMADDALERYGDVVCGVFDGTVVSAYDVSSWKRVQEGRVRFDGVPSPMWSSLIGAPSPVTWTRGQARPVRYVDTDALVSGTAPTEERDDVTRAVVRGFVLTVTEDGAATLAMPVGGTVTVMNPDVAVARDAGDGGAA